MEKKQTKTQKLTVSVCSAVRTLDFETRRINAVLSTVAMLFSEMNRTKENSTHIDVLDGVRFALIDSLGELEKLGENLYDAL